MHNGHQSINLHPTYFASCLFCNILRTFFNQMLATPLQLMHGLSKLLVGLSLIMSIINFVDSNIVCVSFAIFDFFCQKFNPQVTKMIR